MNNSNDFLRDFFKGENLFQDKEGETSANLKNSEENLQSADEKIPEIPEPRVTRYTQKNSFQTQKEINLKELFHSIEKEEEEFLKHFQQETNTQIHTAEQSVSKATLQKKASFEEQYHSIQRFLQTLLKEPEFVVQHAEKSTAQHSYTPVQKRMKTQSPSPFIIQQRSLQKKSYDAPALEQSTPFHTSQKLQKNNNTTHVRGSIEPVSPLFSPVQKRTLSSLETKAEIQKVSAVHTPFIQPDTSKIEESTQEEKQISEAPDQQKKERKESDLEETMHRPIRISRGTQKYIPEFWEGNAEKIPNFDTLNLQKQETQTHFSESLYRTVEHSTRSFLTKLKDKTRKGLAATEPVLEEIQQGIQATHASVAKAGKQGVNTSIHLFLSGVQSSQQQREQSVSLLTDIVEKGKTFIDKLNQKASKYREQTKNTREEQKKRTEEKRKEKAKADSIRKQKQLAQKQAEQKRKQQAQAQIQEQKRILEEQQNEAQRKEQAQRIAQQKNEEIQQEKKRAEEARMREEKIQKEKTQKENLSLAQKKAQELQSAQQQKEITIPSVSFSKLKGQAFTYLASQKTTIKEGLHIAGMIASVFIVGLVGLRLPGLMSQYESVWNADMFAVQQESVSFLLGEKENPFAHIQSLPTAGELQEQTEDEIQANEYLNITPPDTRIVIPKIAKNIPILQVADDSRLAEDWERLETEIQDALRDGVVHYPGTALPGDDGNVFITGHSSYYPWDPGRYKDVFAALHNLEEGDEYFIFHNGKKYRYVITSRSVVPPTDVSVLDQDHSKKESTLMTCTPIGTAKNRLILKAEQVAIEY